MRRAGPAIRTSAAALAVLGLTACPAPRASEVSRGVPPIGRVTLGDLPQLPAEDPAPPARDGLAAADMSDPGSMAAGVVTAGLAEQGLTVEDLGVAITARGARQTTVRVAATYTTPAGRPLTSVWELRLTRDHAGRWSIAGFRQIQ